MSQHASLRVDSVGAKHRNVLKRLERIKSLKKDQRWMDQSSVYGLPKVKSQKIKVKAVKEEKATAPGAEGTKAPEATATKAPAAKAAVAAKKPAEKAAPAKEAKK